MPQGLSTDTDSPINMLKRHNNSSHQQLQLDEENNSACQQRKKAKKTEKEESTISNYSHALTSILSYSDLTIDEFFETTWQHQPSLYKKKKDHNIIPNELAAQEECTFQNVLTMDCDGIMDLLENNYTIHKKVNLELSLRPIYLQNQTPIHPNTIQTQYSHNPFAAYLDGCSIIQNHAEYFSTPIYNLCIDLQKSFPHVYCNTYLTPPNSTTVKAHADDRDVFVIQIKGRKRWKVYKCVPIPYPYSYEQVGKNGIDVPSFVTTTITRNDDDDDDKMLIDTVLEEGDVLYMPRGFVHEASTIDCNNQPSFHATIAIMTSDWSYSKVVSDLIRKCLDQKDEYRMAIPIDIGRSSTSNNNYHNNYHNNEQSNISPSTKVQFQKDINAIMENIQENITMESIASELHTKYSLHNKQTISMKNKFSSLYYDNSVTTTKSEYETIDETNDAANTSNNNNYHNQIIISPPIYHIVGEKAATLVTMNTRVRKSTPNERESVKCGDRGLTVRDNISDALLSIIAQMDKDKNSSWKVSDLHSLINDKDTSDDDDDNNNSKRDLCDNLSICSFVKCCVALGVMSIATS